MSVGFRLVGYSVWALAFGLSVALAWEFHQGQNYIALGVAVLALLVSASGLLMARYSWQRGDYLSMVLGLSLWLAGAVSFTFTELGFWTSSYNERHIEYVTTNAAKVRHEGMTDRAWNALTTGDMPPGPAELKAKLKAAQQHERWRPSKGCTDATLPESRAFCNSYFELQAKLAAAERRQKLESQILASDKPKPQQTSYAHDVFALAASLSRWLGIDEKRAADFIIFSTWILLMLARDTGLLIANPLGERSKQSKAKQSKASEEMQEPVAAHPSPPDPPAKAPVPVLHRPIAKIKVPLKVGKDKPVVQSNAFIKVREDPHRKIVFSPDARAQFPKLAFSEADGSQAKQSNRAKKAKAKAKKHKLSKGVIDWLCEATSSDAETSLPSGRCFDNYKAYCMHAGQPHVGFRVFTGIVKQELGLDDAKRGAGGQTLLPIKLSDPAQWCVERRSAA